MVDRIHPQHHEVFGSRALDEPILSGVFEDGSAVSLDLGGIQVPIPPPHVLLGTKLRSIPGRDREDKVVKDACDIYALLWYSPVSYREMLSLVRDQFHDDCERAASVLASEVAGRAAHHLGVTADSFHSVVRGLSG